MQAGHKSVVVVFSGGQDSTTCLALALRDYGVEHTHCLSFRYGQRHSSELQAAQEIAAHFQVRHHQIIDLEWYPQLAHSSLLQQDAAIQQQPGLPPDTQVDGRNMQFLLLAAIYAKQRGIRDIMLGVSDTESSGYPDCSRTFINSCNQTLNLAMDYNFRLLTPLMELDKCGVWQLADDLDTLEYIAEHTVTCYNGMVGSGCGNCPSCLLRQRGWEAYQLQKELKC